MVSVTTYLRSGYRSGACARAGDRQSARQRLGRDLDPRRCRHPRVHRGDDDARDRSLSRQLVPAGHSDPPHFPTLPLEYGDGSVQGLSLVSDGDGGFAAPHLELIDRLRHPLAAALELTAMQRSPRACCSAAFARAPHLATHSLGRFPLKGVADPQEVFAPILPISKPRPPACFLWQTGVTAASRISRFPPKGPPASCNGTRSHTPPLSESCRRGSDS